MHLSSIWRKCHLLSTHFLSRFRSLLLFREPSTDDTNNADVQSIHLLNHSNMSSGQDSMYFPVTRILILQFLDGVSPLEFDSSTKMLNVDSKEAVFQSGIANLISELIELNFDPIYVRPAIIGSELFGEKLRLWQALCILSKFIRREQLENVIGKCFLILKQNLAHGIRVHIEIFVASMLNRFADIVLPCLIKELNIFNHPAQVSCDFSFNSSYIIYRYSWFFYINFICRHCPPILLFLDTAQNPLLFLVNGATQ